MKPTNIAQWLSGQQNVLDQIILDAAKAYLDQHKDLPNFAYDLQQSQKEAYSLSEGLDLCYDRFTTPLAYSLWYQARRINVFISSFYDKLLEACNSPYPIEIFDLGAGTGCVQFSFGLAYVAFVRNGGNPNFIRCINVDLSPFMLEYLRSYLWPAAIRHYPELKKLPVEYHVNSWSNKGDISVLNPWICASYLFDSSDNEEYLSSNFESLVKSFKPAKIMFLTSSQSKKITLMSGLSKKMKQAGYQITETSAKQEVFTGCLALVDKFRKDLVKRYSLKASTYPVTWQDNSFTSVGLDRIQAGFNFLGQEVPQHLDLFNPPLRIRRDVALNNEQRIAAAFEERPSIITGPAGCGKSIVLTEKIINVLEHFSWSKNVSILITTFNKGLIKQLRSWVSDLLKAKGKEYKDVFYKLDGGVSDGAGEISVLGAYDIKIKFVHFEMLGKYVGKLQYRMFNEKQHIDYIEKFISEVRAELKIPLEEMSDILIPQFIHEEYHRVIYGLGCKISLGQEVYLTLERKGRGKKPQLLYDSKRRKAVWCVLHKYVTWMHKHPESGNSFIARRQLFLNLLEKNQLTDKFDYVFVDEFQDCTAADFRIMSLMLRDANNLVLSGDLAQAVHIGQSGVIPRDTDMLRRKFHKLNGSYRLPCRISEALSPLSKQITANSVDKDVTMEMTPYKGAPPGARPIFVFANDNESLAKKIIGIKSAYGIYDLETVTILEKDVDLQRAIQLHNHPVETTTILKLKGLEKEFVVWSLQAEILFENEVNEFAYTIMTRTNCMLLIAITPRFQQSLLRLALMLRKDRVIIWDSDTEVFCGIAIRTDTLINEQAKLQEI